MPELLEVEQYRQDAERAVGCRVTAVHAPDAWFLKGGLDAGGVTDALLGAELTATSRRGKLLVVHTDRAHTLGLRFGMTGRLVVHGRASIDRLEYSSDRDDPAWDRFGLELTATSRRGAVGSSGSMWVRDPRRLGGVELDPDLGALGPDAATVTRGQLAGLLRGTSPVKARLMDQRQLAGMGNLLTDECLWRAGIDPLQPAGSLGANEVRRVHHHLHRTLVVLGERGGSHTGDLHPQRHRSGCCPRCATPLLRRTIGGRTTYSCPRHQPAGGARAD